MLSSGKIRLRAPEPLDAEFMYQVENDSAAWRYGDTVAPLSRKILRDYANSYDADPFTSGQLRMIVVEAATDNPVGILDLFEISQYHRRAMTGIYILPEHRHSGYALDALSAASRYARGVLHLHQMCAHVGSTNAASLRLFGKAGFRETAVLNDWLSDADGSFSDVILMQLIL